MNVWPILSMKIAAESDVVAVRQRARRIAELIGFDKQDQTRLATAVSEIARNAFEYAKGGKVSFRLAAEKDAAQTFIVAIQDKGPGIGDVDSILEGRFQSLHGMGVGIIGARKLVEHFVIESSGAGTTIELGKSTLKTKPRLTKDEINAIAAQLSREAPLNDPHMAIAVQNQELLHSLDEMRSYQRELDHLNRELEETNRGVVALYGELEEKAEQLRLASEMKTRFLSHMSHEFRTPLNSILALSDLLMKHVDGHLTSDQETQVSFIRRSAESLHEMVNDLLDIAKLEAGRIDLRVSNFSIAEWFSGLRGALKPLQKGDAVQLVFEDLPPGLPMLTTDEGKVGQVIRNFVSNAIKFTLAGEVRVRVGRSSQPNMLLLSVRDTGIGIAPHDRERIFEEFSQIDSPTQRLVKGTGLGLSLCRRLAELLQGKISLESELGKGSTFSLEIPIAIEPNTIGDPNISHQLDVPASRGNSKARATILVVDDDPAFRYAFRQMILARASHMNIIEAADGVVAIAKARDLKPDAIVLDLQMPRSDGYQVLEELAADENTRAIPVLISSSADYDAVAKDRLTAARGFLSKRDLSEESVAAALQRVLEHS